MRKGFWTYRSPDGRYVMSDDPVDELAAAGWQVVGAPYFAVDGQPTEHVAEPTAADTGHVIGGSAMTFSERMAADDSWESIPKEQGGG